MRKKSNDLEQKEKGDERDRQNGDLLLAPMSKNTREPLFEVQCFYR